MQFFSPIQTWKPSSFQTNFLSYTPILENPQREPFNSHNSEDKGKAAIKEQKGFLIRFRRIKYSSASES